MTSPIESPRHDSPSPAVPGSRTATVLLSMPDLSQPAMRPPASQPAPWNWTSKPRFALAGMMVVIVALTAMVFRQGTTPAAKTTTTKHAAKASANSPSTEAPNWMGPSPVATLPDDHAGHSSTTHFRDSAAPHDRMRLPQAAGPGQEAPFDDEAGPNLRAPDSDSLPGSESSFNTHSAPMSEPNAILDQEMKVEQARANRLHAQEEFISACRALEEFNRGNGRDLLAAEKAVSEQQAKLLLAEQDVERQGRLVRKGFGQPANRQFAEMAVKSARMELEAAISERDHIRNVRGQGSLEQLLTAKEVAAAEMGIAQTEYVTELAKLDQLRSMPAAALAARMGTEAKSAATPDYGPAYGAPQPVRVWDDSYGAAGGVARLQGGIEK